MATVIETYAGDSSPNITFNVSRVDGSIVNLTGATVKFIIQNPVTGKHTNDANNLCVVANSTTVVYSWNTAGTDIPVAGIYKSVLQITYPDNQLETYAISISAQRRI